MSVGVQNRARNDAGRTGLAVVGDSVLHSGGSCGDGVKECWMVLGPEKQIEVYRKSRSGEIALRRVLGQRGALESVAVPGFRVELEKLFSR